MKKIITVLFLCLALSAMLAACADDNDEESAGIIVGVLNEGSEEFGTGVLVEGTTKDYEMGGVPLE